MQVLLQKASNIIGAIARRPLLLIVLTVAVIVLMMVTRPKLAPVQLPERIWPVDVVEVWQQDEQPSLNLFGQVAAGRRTELRAQVPGRVVEVGEGFNEGARVTQGDFLVQVDPFEYNNNVAEQKALLSEAQTRMNVVRRDLGRIKELHTEKNVSDQQLDDAGLAVKQQEATLAQRRIGLDRAQRDLEDARLVAPFNGVVNGVSADLGKQLSVNDKIAEIIDTTSLEVRFTLSKSQYGRIIEAGEALEGRLVEVSWQVGDGTMRFAATVERVGAEIDSTTGGVDVYAVIEPDEETLLRPGAFVWTKITDRKYENVYRAAESSLYGDEVYIVNKENRLEARPIKVHGYAGEDVLFSSAGQPPINNGDKVVTTQIREGGAGIKVEIR
ncbi:MAG: efflux RND transporter periplasmic adaptor subunit [Gammaproteobacteria bacterium]|nr:efflux RND transporter periplasmic adaptor subunit [Gammaproteobacteria bacterium]MCP4089854.1 efflux RND transporter periplasmic adaptor subunit [Gammaproteobacteria bacterium]MCP4275509.1 efflux RND transporter periplasmic adaptor subunit [Gammaproteobacteria bacterium]MCP4833001.1 efflux RND transporter periplasmic adaptor subunit [Gammaproteobacteria bacterium]MCP4928627.1 efflux RND transporter periplasmic adaptor subunit [Gammaproteobacteria bacterium]